MAPYLFSRAEGIAVLLFNSECEGVMSNMFFGNASHTTMYVGDGVTTIPAFLCYNFAGLQRVVYAGNTVRKIGECAFVNCRELRTLQIPSGVDELGLNAFAHCDPQQVLFEPERPPRMRGNPFFGMERYIYVAVPCGTRQYYVNTVAGRYFDALQYSDDCPLVRSGEVLYVHDTVWIHDTVYVTREVAPEEMPQDEKLSDWMHLEGKVLCITQPDRLEGRVYQLFDHNGRMVSEGSVPKNVKGEYRIPLPKRRRYYIGFEGESPLALDVPTGEVK